MTEYTPIYSDEKGLSVRAKINKTFYDLTIGPEGVNELWVRLANLQYLRVSKTYATFDDMIADRVNPIRDDGYPLKNGELVMVLTDLDPSKRGFYRKIEEGFSFIYAFSTSSHSQLEDIRTIGDLDLPENARDIHLTTEQATKFLNLLENSPEGSYLRKDVEDIAKEKITFEKGIDVSGYSNLDNVTIKSYVQSPIFRAGFLGEGFKLFKDNNGDWSLDIDKLLVRKTMDIFQMTINKLQHVGGSFMATPASGEIKEVEEYPTFYRCYLQEPDNNHFVQFDQAICQVFTGSNTKRYWRLVVYVAPDGSYIDLSKSDSESGSAVPEKGDEIVQLGNRTIPERQNAIYLSSYGTHGPYQQFLTGVNSYDLTDKVNVQLSGEDTFFRASRFEVISSDGNIHRIPVDKGEWVDGTFFYYDRVSHLGALWLCIAQPSTTEEPKKGSHAWQEQVTAGSKGDSLVFNVSAISSVNGGLISNPTKINFEAIFNGEVAEIDLTTVYLRHTYQDGDWSSWVTADTLDGDLASNTLTWDITDVGYNEGYQLQAKILHGGLTAYDTLFFPNIRSGFSVTSVSLYKRSDKGTTPIGPTQNLTFDFTTGILLGNLQGWTLGIPAVNGQPLWEIHASASSSTTIDVIESSEWSDAEIIMEDGSNGTDGVDGYNTAIVTLQKRSLTKPSGPSDQLTYNFTTGTFTGNLNGWIIGTPEKSNHPIWAITAVAKSRTNTDAISANEWSEAVILVEDGHTPYIGENGNWYIWNSTTGEYVDSKDPARGDDGHSPEIRDGYWWTWENGSWTNTGVKAEGEDGEDGHSFTLSFKAESSVKNGTLVNPTRFEFIFMYDDVQVSVPLTEVQVRHTNQDGTWGSWLNAADATDIPSSWDITDEGFDNGYTLQAKGTYLGYTAYDSIFFPNVIDGTDGKDAPLLMLLPTSEIMTFGADGYPKPSSQTIIITAKIQNVTGTATFVAIPYKGSSPQTAITLGGSGNNRTLTQGQWAIDVDIIEVTATLGTLSDKVTLHRITHGADSIIGYLTNENVTFPATNSGVVASGDFSLANSNFRVYEGTTLVASGVTYSRVSQTGCTTAITTAGAITVSAMSADKASAVFRAVYKGVTIEKTLTLSKSKVGEAGQPGTNGINTYAISLYRRSLSAPNKPTATLTYNFVTGVLSTSGINGWSVGIPASNGSPLWEIHAVASSNTETDTIPVSEWSTPEKILEDGVSISGVVNYYLASSASSGVTTSTTGWTTTMQTVTSSKKYLWNYEVISYSDGSTPTTTTPAVIGNYSIDGKGISKIEEFYQVSASNTTAPTTWVATPPTTTTTNKYLWNYEKITYSDGSTPTETKKRVIGTHGASGTNGTDGYNTAVLTLYQRSASKPSKPSATLTYTFATGVLTGTMGNWTLGIPASAKNPIWATSAMAIAKTTTDTISASEWSDPVIYVEDVKADIDEANSEAIKKLQIYIDKANATVEEVDRVATSVKSGMTSLGATTTEVNVITNKITAIKNARSSLTTYITPIITAGTITNAQRTEITNRDITFTDLVADFYSHIESISFSHIKQNKDSITSAVNSINTIDGKVTTHGTTISQHATEISNRVTTSTYNSNNNLINTKFSQINQRADVISLLLYEKTEDYNILPNGSFLMGLEGVDNKGKIYHDGIRYYGQWFISKGQNTTYSLEEVQGIGKVLKVVVPKKVGTFASYANVGFPTFKDRIDGDVIRISFLFKGDLSLWDKRFFFSDNWDSYMEHPGSEYADDPYPTVYNNWTRLDFYRHTSDGGTGGTISLSDQGFLNNSTTKDYTMEFANFMVEIDPDPDSNPRPFKIKQADDIGSVVATGINIKDKEIVTSADTFKVQDNSGNPIAVFKNREDGTPVVRAKNIEVEGLTLKSFKQEVGNGGKMLLDNTGLSLYGEDGQLSIRIGIIAGEAVIQYYTNGQVNYVVGPSGPTPPKAIPGSWNVVQMVKVSNTYITASFTQTVLTTLRNIMDASVTTLYRYTSAIVDGVVQDPINNGKLFTTQNLSGTKVSGVFFTKPSTEESLDTGYQGSGRDTLLSDELLLEYFPDIYLPYNKNFSLHDMGYICKILFLEYSQGSIVETSPVYWNKWGREQPPQPD